MTRKIDVKIDMILHATEDYLKIADVLYDMFAIKKTEILKRVISGHFGNTISMLHVDIKKNRAEEFVKKLISQIPKVEMANILDGLQERINNSTLYLRFSKQNFVKKTLTPEEKDPVRIIIYTPVYVKKEILSTYKKLLAN